MEKFLKILSKDIIIVTSREFFISVLADGLLVEFDRQQISSSLQDSFQYSGRS